RFALLLDGDDEEDTLVFHPDGAIDDRPQRDPIDTGRGRRAHLEREGRAPAGRDEGLALHRDAIRRGPAHAEPRPLGVIGADAEIGLRAANASYPGLRSGVREPDR